MSRVLLLAALILVAVLSPLWLSNLCLNVGHLALWQDEADPQSLAQTLFAQCAQWSTQPARLTAMQGQQAFYRGDYPGAIMYLDPVEESGAANQLMHWQMGMSYQAVGDSDRAIREWQAADAAPFFMNQSLRFRHDRDWRGAEQALHQATAIEPADPELARTFGEFYWEWGKLESAQTELKRALLLEARPYERALLQAELEHLAGQPDAARVTYQQAMAIDSARPEAYLRLANLLVERAQPHNAIEVLTNALPRVNPPFGICLRLAQLLTAQGDYAAADNYLVLAQSMEPANDEPWLARAQNALGQEEYATAETALEHALELSPTNPENYFWLGQVLAHSGRCTEALNAFARAVALAPDDPRFNLSNAVQCP